MNRPPYMEVETVRAMIAARDREEAERKEAERRARATKALATYRAARAKRKSLREQILQVEKTIREAYDPDIARWDFYIELLTNTALGIMGYAVFALLMCVLQ